MLNKLKKIFSLNARKRRGNIFKAYLKPTSKDKILDLGSGDGSNLAQIISFRKNVFSADLSEFFLKKCRKLGFQTILLKHSDNKLPFPNKYFDIIFCSSVIEHATGNKMKLKKYHSYKEFYRQAYHQQKLFAQEIRRVGIRYFVQTPNKYFPIESHTLLPFFIIFLPYKLRLFIIKVVSSLFFWPQYVAYPPDWHLLTKKELNKLFPDAFIIEEKFFGLTKSFMVIKT